MDFRIADTFTDSLARLSGDEQKAAKTTAFDLQLNPANPGMQFHKLDKARDKNFWSVRVNADIRLIVHKTAGSLLLCYVDHHDKAYGWAERRKLQAHPKTGAAQLVEVRETVQEIVIPTYVEAKVSRPAATQLPLFDRFSDDDLLGYGVPAEWLVDVRSATEDTGKTIVALHRAVHLARTHRDARVLLTTFSDSLAAALSTKLRRLIGNEPRLAERIDVHSLVAIGQRLYKSHVGPMALATREAQRELLKGAATQVPDHKFSLHFLFTEWEQVVDAWQLDTWAAYREVARLGRKTRLPEAQRALLWSIFDRVRNGLRTKNLVTQAGMFTELAESLAAVKNLPFDFVVVDEAQDISVAQLRFLSALGANRPNALFFAGDLGQRIFQQPFSWKSLGVDVRGRSRTLRVNYRTSHQIRRQADRLLGPELTDVDGNSEVRSDAVSVFNGPPPIIRVLKNEGEEIKSVGSWMTEQSKAGVLPHELGIFVRSAGQLSRAQAAVKEAGLPFRILDDHIDTISGHVSICTMHLAKGLEFRAVAVMACDDEIIPLQERIETVGDDADLQEVYDTERHLLYVACTRARDHLLVTSVEPASEFLDDLRT